MKIWDYIKNKLFDRKKALPEPTGQTRIIAGKPTVPNTKKEAFDAALKVDVDIKPNTLDFAIDQYMAALIEEEKNGLDITTYDTLIKLGAMQNTNFGNNDKNEKQFLENLNNDEYGYRVNFDKQSNADGSKVYFYHIMNSQKSEEQVNYRIYLNCKKENVGILADKLARELKEQEYYFKFCADENNTERSEQFVFYIDDKEDLQKKISIIEKINMENPELFEGAYSVNPFMRAYKGYIAYTPQIKSGIYNDLSGNSRKIDKSYNDLLSCALEDSFVESMKKLAMNEMKIKEGSDIYNYKTVGQLAYSKLLEYAYDDPNLKLKFIESVKQNLKLASEKNLELDIKGIDTKARTQEKTNIDYTPENF